MFSDRKHILVGMPLVGKTTVGIILSDMLETEFIDLDSYIEKKTSISPKDIIDNYGEKEFRKYEYNALLELVDNKNDMVISLGGGAFSEQKIFNFINNQPNLISIYLQEDLNIIKERFQNDSNNRPLIKNIKDIDEIYKVRKDFYLQADFVVKCNSLSPYKVAKNVREVVL